jgi:predicted transcriptional regulator
MQLREWLSKVNRRPADFAAEIGVSRRSVYRYLSGRFRPDWDVISKIRVATGGQVAAADWERARPRSDGRNVAAA